CRTEARGEKRIWSRALGRDIQQRGPGESRELRIRKTERAALIKDGKECADGHSFGPTEQIEPAVLYGAQGAEDILFYEPGGEGARQAEGGKAGQSHNAGG